ncbi:MAG TPA: hypothetical protein DDX71_03205 [Ruminococcus sp.]|nr:hypothetical protein [Ruminococcus sp.]
MDEQKQPQPKKEQQMLHKDGVRPPTEYMTAEERQNWSGLGSWHDPLDREQEDPRGGRASLASLLFGIISILTICASALSAPLGAAAIICGIIARRREEDISKMSAVGIVLGIISFGAGIAVLLIYLFKRFMAPDIAGGLSPVPV